MKRMTALYEYLTVTESSQFSIDAAISEYKSICNDIDAFRDSQLYIDFAHVADPNSVYDDSVDVILNALARYSNRCGQLLMLRRDPKTASTLFPLVSAV